MLRAENLHSDKLMSALEGLQFDGRELELAEKYMKGEIGEEALAGIAFRDIQQLSADKPGAFYEPFESLIRKKKFGEAEKLFNLVYAAGGSTCSACFRYIYDLRNKVLDGDMKLDRVKILAVFTQSIAANSRYITSLALKNHLAPLADFDPETVLKAHRDYKGQYSNGNILLLTLYFFLRCPNAGGEKIVLSDADRAVLEEYETYFTDSLGMIFQPDASGDTNVSGLVKQVRQGSLAREQLRALRGRNVNDTIFELLGGCSFVNYMLSERLRFVVMFCAAASPWKMLEVIEKTDVRGEMKRLGGELEEPFGIPCRQVITWAAERLQSGFTHPSTIDAVVTNSILRNQFKTHRADFLAVYKKADFQAATRMADIIRESEPELYEKEVLSKGEEQRDKVISLLVNQTNLPRECRDYLAGTSDLSALYAVRGQLSGRSYSSYGARRALEQYADVYRDEAFYGRSMTLMALGDSGYFFTYGKEVSPEDLQRIFRGMNQCGLALDDQLRVVSMMVDSSYLESKKTAITQGCIPIFRQYLAERTPEMTGAFARAGAYGRYFALLVYGDGEKLCLTEGTHPCEEALAETARGEDAWREQILSYSQDGSKLVRQQLEQLLTAHRSWRPQVTALLSSKKAAERELGIRVLSSWNEPQDLEALQKLCESEKNAKVRALLDTALGHAPQGAGAEGNADGNATGNAITREDLVKELHKGGKKRSLAWAYETPFSPVHRQNGEEASEEYLQALLLCYSSMSKPGVSSDAALLAQELEPGELAVYVGELFDKWMEAGAEAKKRWVLFAASIHGGSDIVQRLYHQIQEWPQMARGAIASDAVQALALNPLPQALLIVDGIARKFKFKQVKTAAGQALEFAAAQLGLTREQLEDKIVPDLGFDENMERRFDYGSRSFTVTVTPALEVEIFDESGKRLKNMPSPGAKDDVEKAAASYAAFKELKKQMKATVTSQKQRLELALSAERLWTAEAWQALFVRNPIMHQFAIGLIWGAYEDHKLIRSFRYMEDGTFNTEDEEEYSLPAQGQIGLVHPIELSPESLESWKQQLEDYEITQPIEQLNRTVYYLTEEEQDQKRLKRFGGMLINDLSLGGKLAALGWYRGSVQDAGCFDTFYREDASLGLGAELHFSGSFVGSGSMGGEEVTVYDVRFYKAGSVERGSYCYDEADDQKQLPLKALPRRYFSEVVWQMTKATASSKERDEDWEKQAR